MLTTQLPVHTHTHTHTHTRLTALSLRLPGWASTRKVKPIWISLKQETVSGSGISWAMYKSAPCSRQIIMPAPHHSVFYRPDALHAAQPASKHWRHLCSVHLTVYCLYGLDYRPRPSSLAAQCAALTEPISSLKKLAPVIMITTVHLQWTKKTVKCRF